MTIGLSATLRIARPGVLLHFCPACERAHEIDIHAISRDGNVIGWDGDHKRPSIGEPVRHEKDGAICEYMLRAGVLYFFESCTHALAGRSRHLPVFP